MTGLEDNRVSICPLRFRIASPRVPIDLGCAAVNRHSWGGDPELVRQPLGSTLFWGIKFFFQWILFASIPNLQNIWLACHQIWAI